MIQIQPSVLTTFDIHLVSEPSAETLVILSESGGTTMGPPISIAFGERWSTVTFLPFTADEGTYDVTIKDAGTTIWTGVAYISGTGGVVQEIEGDDEYLNTDTDYTYE